MRDTSVITLLVSSGKLRHQAFANKAHLPKRHERRQRDKTDREPGQQSNIHGVRAGAASRVVLSGSSIGKSGRRHRLFLLRRRGCANRLIILSRLVNLRKGASCATSGNRHRSTLEAHRPGI